MGIEGTDPFAAKPDPRLSRCCSGRAGSTRHSPMAKASRLPHLPSGRGSRSYFMRLVRLSYLAPDITKAILDGRQPGDLTAEKLLEHSRCRLPGTDQRIVLGFA